VIAACLAAAPARAGALGRPRGDVPFEINADSLEYESAREIYVARGSVVLRQGDTSIRADWVTFSNVTRRGAASGNVVITDGAETLYTRFVQFDVRNLRGVLFDGRFAAAESQFRLEGAEIAKTGEDTYHFEKGTFTTCRCPAGGRDPWRIRAEEADLEIGGYGTARNTTFDVLGVPVVWLPWMVYPLKTERESGFLLPDLSLGGRNGFEVGLPFFWAVADPLNATLTPRWMSKRGFKGDLEVESLIGEQSSLDAFGSFVHDQEIDPHSNETPYGRERWGALTTHELHLPLEVVARTDAAFASDNDYVIDFRELSEWRSDRWLPATTFAGRAFGSAGRFGGVAASEFADDLQSPDDRDRDKYMLQRLPNVELAALPARLPVLSFLVPTTLVQYTYYAALRGAEGHLPFAMPVGGGRFLDTGIDALPDPNEQGGGVDPHLDDFLTNGGPEGDGLFQEGEPLGDRGHRLRLTPRLGAPIRFADAVELYPEAGWHQMLYSTDEQGGEQWGVFTGRADLRTRFEGRFAGGSRHLVEPRLGWAMLTRHGQSDEPLFMPATAVPQSRIRQLDLDNVVLDPADRKRRSNRLTWGVANRIFGAPDEGAAARLLADFEISSAYEFYDGELADVYLDGRAYPTASTRARFNAGFDPEEQRLDEMLAQFGASSEGGHAFAVAYRYLRDIPRFFEDFAFDDERFDHFERDFDRINQIDGSLRLALSSQWAATYRVAYSFEQSLLLANEGGIEYYSRCRCWAVRLEIQQDRVRDVQFNLVYSLTGLGEEGGPFAHSARLGGIGLLDGL
jgi:lipopolysaccharide assembly outer membrane protein LptD (OstA)